MIETVRQRALRSLLPPPSLSLANWIESSVHLPGTVSALSGRVELWQFQRGICEAIDDPDIERVTVIKPVRVGYTTLLTSTIASFAANSPAPILVVVPTEADARDYMVSDIEPTFDASPALRSLLSSDGDEGGRNTLLSRRFPAGSLKLVAAKSPRNLRRHTAKVLLLDEIDGMEPSAEGDPITLAERRTMSFAGRKIIAGSTPVFDHGPVSRLYAQSDQRVFEVPCPSCGGFSEIMWSHIEWEQDRPETACFRCPHCCAFIDERHKVEMVSKGAWRATAPHVKAHAGFRLNALISPHANASWAKLAAEFVAAKDDPATLQTFTNTLLGQPWREAADELDEADLVNRREPFGLDAIPAEVLAITAGVDCQDDRLELVLMGHGKNETFVLAHMVVWGPIADETVWRELDEALRSTWRHPDGRMLRVDAAVIDAGDGGHMDTVKSFTRSRFGRRIVAGKGVTGFSRPNLQRSTTRGVPLFLVGVDAIKSQLYGRLARGSSVRFSADLEPIYFEQLTSERRVIRYVKGLPIRRFERIVGKRAETLDATVYAMAAFVLVNALIKKPEPQVGNPRNVIRTSTVHSRWLS
ncbi:phage terminase large subunit family protein [Aurantimonas coralicida]|uniref:phage terminase large subunit family protein n=1 Tax=Aurantimonas coralicida TaxID=182270 RepID=UPI00238BD3A3|nr:phage terminase large subunit family protein [Aurantimonas coralicida]MDE0921798.1 phage terminase large subunit family protein [Aurantimonas coralicida]